MDNDLLYYYNQELSFVRQLANEFAKAHPKIAGRLRLSAETIEDPHVARLIESFALLTARIRHKLDDDFPELTQALFNILYPQYLAPIPAMSIVQFQASSQLMADKYFPKGTNIASSKEHGEQCLFSTSYPISVLPITILQAKLTGQPLQAPLIASNLAASSSLCLTLSCSKENLTFADIAFDQLRFFINAPMQQAYALYELLFQHRLTVAIAGSDRDPEPVFFDEACIQPVGFNSEEGMLPYDARTFAGYRLLIDFFSFPEKFLFFDIIGLKQTILEKFKQKNQPLKIYIYFNRGNLELEKYLDSSYFVLGCTPVINLFEQQAEPIILTHTKTEYQLIPDAHRATRATEVYSIKQIIAISQVDGNNASFQPLYSLKHQQEEQEVVYWHANRRPGWEGEHYIEQGTEVFLAFSNIQTYLNNNDKAIINANLLCTNRDLPNQLPFNANEPLLEFWHKKETTINKIKCLKPFTSAKRLSLKKNLLWKVLSHMSLNKLSLAGGEESLLALKEILRLYNLNDTYEIQTMIDGLIKLTTRNITARNPHIRGNVFWQGIEITLEVDEKKYSGTSIFLFIKILEHFFALYVSLNHFIQLVIITRDQGEIYRGKPRAGEKALL